MNKRALLLDLVFVVAIIASVVYLDISTMNISKPQGILGTDNILARGYTINNEKLNLTAYVTIVNSTYTIYAILTNEGYKPINYTFNVSLVATSGNILDAPCSATLVTINIAKGYYTSANLTKASYIDYFPYTVYYCPAIIIEKNTVNLYPFVPHVYYLPILGGRECHGNSTFCFFSDSFQPLKPGVYTIVVKDVFNQTLILHVNFPTYVGGVVFHSNHGVYLISALPVKEIELINGNEIEVFKVDYISPFNGVIFVNVTLYREGDWCDSFVYGPYFKILINNTWVEYHDWFINENLNLPYSGIAVPKQP